MPFQLNQIGPQADDGRTTLDMGAGKQLLALTPMQLRSAAAARLGDQARDTRRFDEAARHYAEALALCPDAVHLHVQRGHCLKEIGELEGARQAYQAYVAKRPDDPDIHLQMGHLAKREGEKDLAFQSYSKALSLAGNSSLIGRESRREIEAIESIKDLKLFDSGLSYLRERKFEEAYQALSTSLDAYRPGYFAVLVGHSCKETGRFSEARLWYEAQLAHAEARWEEETDQWIDAVLQLAALDDLEMKHFSAFKLFAASASRLEQKRSHSIERVDAFWSLAQRSLTKITSSILLEC